MSGPEGLPKKSPQEFPGPVSPEIPQHKISTEQKKDPRIIDTWQQTQENMQTATSSKEHTAKVQEPSARPIDQKSEEIKKELKEKQPDSPPPPPAEPATHLSLKNIDQVIAKLDEEEGKLLVAEFAALTPNDPLKYESECKISLQPENWKYNRYNNVFSLDVALYQKAFEGIERATDYINASQISDDQVATQGPLLDIDPSDNSLIDTVGRFFEMVIAGGSNTILNYTKASEGNRRKCADYWDVPWRNPSYKIELADGSYIKRSDADTREIFGNDGIRIAMKYTFQRFKDGKRVGDKIALFHFDTWPDHGVPKKPDHLIDFFQIVDATHDIRGPIVNHCSAGIGRTGVGIAAFDFYREIKDKLGKGIPSGQIEIPSVFEKVNAMRTKRVGMVQVKEQYKLIYQGVKEMLERAKDDKLLEQSLAMKQAIDKLVEAGLIVEDRAKAMETLKKPGDSIIHKGSDPGTIDVSVKSFRENAEGANIIYSYRLECYPNDPKSNEKEMWYYHYKSQGKIARIGPYSFDHIKNAANRLGEIESKRRLASFENLLQEPFPM